MCLVFKLGDASKLERACTDRRPFTKWARNYLVQGRTPTRSRKYQMAAEHICLSCRHSLAGPILDLGELPACNRFSKVPSVADSHRMTVTACPSCGLVQLLDPAPAEMIVPRVPWIRYNEPEAHLDDVAKELLGLFRETPRTALGVGPFDAPLLTRLESLSLTATSVDLLAGLPAQGYPPAFPYLETIQSHIRPATFAHAERSRADIVLCRYLLEHSHDPLASLAALRRLMTPEGVLLIEVPDSSKFLAALDYCFLWEEHVCYFVESTIKSMAVQAGFEVAALLRYEGQLEDALVMILRQPGASMPTTAIPVADLSAFQAYQSLFPARRDAYRMRLQDLSNEGKVALIGIGHQSIMFVNEFGLQPFISFLVDDDPNKLGCFAPGTSQRIVSSSSVVDRTDIAACLLAVSPRVEPKVRGKLRGLIDQGAKIYPIYAGAQGKKLIGNGP